jgi:UDP-2,4-diacetamido-2,4,6-trideoxy-beta-L-altropyranose hydrolase
VGLGIRTLLIRADAGLEIGTGHVMRCLALAQAWQDAGGEAVFAMAKSVASLDDLLAREKMQVLALNCEPGDEADAAQTITAAQRKNAVWIVADGYGFGSEYQSQIKSAGFRLLFVDDLGHCEHYHADLILNQNLHADEIMYANRDERSRLLLGPRFALLRREFCAANEERSVPEMVEKLLIAFGGSDSGNATSKVLKALEYIETLTLQATVVIGAANPHFESLAQLSSVSRHRIKLVRQPESIASLMTSADLAISAAGSTCWELCLLGVPSLLLAIAKNQQSVGEALTRKGVSLYIGPAENVVPEVLASQIAQLLRSKQRREQMCLAGRSLVDGRGRARVIRAMHDPGVKLRRATAEDCELLWKWTNEPTVRAASFQSAFIPWKDHRSWFAEKLAGRRSVIYIGEDQNGEPFGQFRVDRDGNEAEVHVSVCPEKRGLGLAPALIAKGCESAFRDSTVQRLRARIKPENQASLRAFAKAGFTDFTQTVKTVHCKLERETTSQTAPGPGLKC